MTAAGCADVTQIKKIIAMKPNIISFFHPLTGNTVLVSGGRGSVWWAEPAPDQQPHPVNPEAVWF